jgi:hypothetical protein
LGNRRKQHRVPEELLALQDQYVHVAGEVASVAVETDSDPRKIDHVWLTLRAGEFGRVQVALSTCSRQSAAAGLDPRVSLGVVASSWQQLPVAGLAVATGLDYAALEGEQPIDYVPTERPALERLLLAKARRAILAEAWGQFYVRAHLGVHQIHSRRASLAVPRDHVGQDGALRFYFDTGLCEMLLFKFAGQP